MANLTPNPSFSLTIRIEIPNRIGMLASVTNAIASSGGNLGQIDLIEQTRKISIRDSLFLNDGDVGEAIGLQGMRNHSGSCAMERGINDLHITEPADRIR